MKLGGFALVTALVVALVAGENEKPLVKSVEIHAGEGQGKALSENNGRALRGLEEAKDGNENPESDGVVDKEQWDRWGPHRGPWGPPRGPWGPPRGPWGPPRGPWGPPRGPWGPPRGPWGPRRGW